MVAHSAPKTRMYLVLALLFCYGVQVAFGELGLLAQLCSTDNEGDSAAYQSAGLVGNYVITSSRSQPQGSFGQTYVYAPKPVIQAWNCSGSGCVSQGIVCDATHSTCSQPSDYKSSLDSAVPKSNALSDTIQDTVYSNNTFATYTNYYWPTCASPSVVVMQLNQSAYLSHARINPSPATYYSANLGSNCMTSISWWRFSGSSWSKVTASVLRISVGRNRVYTLPTPSINYATTARPTFYAHFFFVHDLYRTFYLVPKYTGFTTTALVPSLIARSDDRTVALISADLSGGSWSYYATFGFIPTSPVSNGSYSASSAASGYDDLFLFADDSGAVPVRQSFAFASTVNCLAVGRPIGETSATTFLYGSVYIYCAGSTSWSLQVPRFTVNGAYGFGYAVKFARGDTVLAVSAPSSAKVYLFAFNPTSRTLNTTAFETYTGPSTSTGFGTIFDINDEMLVITAPSTTTCDGDASTSGTVYVYADATDCQFSDWVGSGPCSVTCGIGSQAATRTITQAPQFNGTICPELSGTIACDAGPCPVDCVVGDWVLNSTCNATCDGGVANATRSILVQPVGGGAACPTNLFRTDFPCNTQPCFQNCTVSDWTEYSNCSAACGTGVKYRNRTIVLPSYGGGTPCPALNETTSCIVTPCPVDCVLGEFELESNCSALCGTGYEVYRAPIVTPAAYGGKDCNPFQFSLCNRQPCDTNVYQNCSFKCNGTDAFYNVTTVQGNASSLDSAGCNVTCVTLSPVDCLVAWYDIQACSKPCIEPGSTGNAAKAGVTLQAFNVTRPALYGGRPCPEAGSVRTGICGNFYCGSPDYFLNCTANCSRLADPLEEEEERKLPVSLGVGVAAGVLVGVCVAWGCIRRIRRRERVEQARQNDQALWEAQRASGEGVTIYESYSVSIGVRPVLEGKQGEYQ